VLVTSLMGGVFHPFWVADGRRQRGSLGELSGYLLGFSGKTVIERTPVYVRMENWMRKYGEWAVLVLAFIPTRCLIWPESSPVRSACTFALPVWCWLGKVLKMLLFAYGGATIINFFPFQ
jgi:membrane protein YqaA with SNARE-associated domain